MGVDPSKKIPNVSVPAIGYMHARARLREAEAMRLRALADMGEEPDAPAAWDNLRPREQAFLVEYMREYDAAAAAIAVGYPADIAQRQGGAILRRPRVRAALTEELGAHGITRDVLVTLAKQMLYRLDMADFEPYLDGQETLAQLRRKGVPTSLIRRASKGKSRAIEVPDKLAILERLAKLIGADQETHNVNISGPNAGDEALDALCDEVIAVCAEGAGEERQLPEGPPPASGEQPA